MKLHRIVAGTAVGLALALAPQKIGSQSDFVIPHYNLENSTRYDWESVRGDVSYGGVSRDSIQFSEIGKGLYFDTINVYKKGALIDRVAITKIDPKQNKIRVFSGYDEKTRTHESLTVEEWQEKTGASILINSAQYQANPWARPCALMICDGELKGPVKNQSVRGMFLAEPKDSTLPKIQMLDSQYDEFNNFMFPMAKNYNQGVAHWPILLNRNGEIKVFATDWQANRTAIAKDRQGNVLMFTSEGGFFNLFNFGKFLKESGLNIETAMPMDGGYEAEMCVKVPGFNYKTYGQFETYGPEEDVSIARARCALPAVIGIFPRK